MRSSKWQKWKRPKCVSKMFLFQSRFSTGKTKICLILNIKSKPRSINWTLFYIDLLEAEEAGATCVITKNYLTRVEWVLSWDHNVNFLWECVRESSCCWSFLSVSWWWWWLVCVNLPALCSPKPLWLPRNFISAERTDRCIVSNHTFSGHHEFIIFCCCYFVAFSAESKVEERKREKREEKRRKRHTQKWFGGLVWFCGPPHPLILNGEDI